MPTAAASTVDVWLNNTLLLDDFNFRTASPFVDAQAGVDLTVGIAPSNSTMPSDAIAQFNYNLADGETYIIVANGIVSASGYMPAPAFNLDVFAQGRESAMMAGNTDILAIHGSTDAPTVDVYESGVLNTTAIDDLSYPDFAGYLELPTADYTLEVRTADNSTIVAAYSAPLATLNLQGAALTVVASGFLDPSMNSNGPAFGLFVASPAGGALLALPAAAIPTARVQVIHNSADAAASTVDVWLNNTLLLDDFAFQTASPFVDAQAGVDLTVGIAPSNSTMPSDAIAQFNYNLMDGETYIIVANGIVSTSGYTPNQPFDLYVYAGARETATSGASNTDILVFHGSTDAPTVDISETAVLGGATLVSGLSYGNYSMGYLEPPTNDYTLLISSGGNPVASYDAPLATLGLDGAAITVLASGFLDPSMNSNGSPFGLYAATAAGGPLVALPLSTSIEENSILSGLVAWPNPVNDQLFVDLNTLQNFQASLLVTDLTGRVVRSQEGLQVAAGESRMVLDMNGLSNGMYQVSIVGTDILRTVPVQVMRSIPRPVPDEQEGPRSCGGLPIARSANGSAVQLFNLRLLRNERSSMSLSPYLMQFSIRDLEEFTGVKAHTIRMWEKRYGLLAPERTDTNIRTYSLEELKSLLNISYLNHNGYKISKIAALNEADRQRLVQDVSMRTKEGSDILNSLKLAMLSFDEALFDSVTNRYRGGPQLRRAAGECVRSPSGTDRHAVADQFHLPGP